MVKRPVKWLPSRQDILLIDCNPQVGQEMRDINPFLVLSPRNFNDKTSLVKGLSMTTAVYNVDNPFAASMGEANSEKVSYVLCHQPKSFDWRVRKAKPHPFDMLDDSLFSVICERLNRLVMLNDYDYYNQVSQ